MLENLIHNSGYLGITIISIVSNTPIPMATEPFIAAMIYKNYNIWLISLFASVGGLIGSFVDYKFGRLGEKFFLSKYFKKKSKYRERAEKFYNKYKEPLLLFSWFPIFGDLFCIIAGVTKTNLKKFAFWVFTGKLIRFISLCLILRNII